MKLVDLFAPPMVGNQPYVRPKSVFPAEISAPSVAQAAQRTPLPDVASTILAPLELGDLPASVLVGVALLLGPDFLLAPAGLVTRDGFRPGYALERVLGETFTPEAQWLQDRRERLRADAPLEVRAAALVPFLAAGLLTERLLLVALEDPAFVLSLGVLGCLGGGSLELLRPALPTREERDREEALQAEFAVFARERLALTGRCNELDVVRAFRRFYPRYRFADMGRATDGVSLPDKDIADQLREWNARAGRPGKRTSSGFYKGISVLEPEQA